jgi:hypothetical protein
MSSQLTATCSNHTPAPRTLSAVVAVDGEAHYRYKVETKDEPLGYDWQNCDLDSFQAVRLAGRPNCCNTQQAGMSNSVESSRLQHSASRSRFPSGLHFGEKRKSSWELVRRAQWERVGRLASHSDRATLELSRSWAPNRHCECHSHVV